MSLEAERNDLRDRLKSAQSLERMAIEQWKQRGRELNALYAIISNATGGPTNNSGDPIADLESLVAERDRFRIAINRIHRDRREPDKVLGECHAVMPELASTIHNDPARRAIVNECAQELDHIREAQAMDDADERDRMRGDDPMTDDEWELKNG